MTQRRIERIAVFLGSNVGQGQIKAADYVLVAEVQAPGRRVQRHLLHLGDRTQHLSGSVVKARNEAIGVQRDRA